MKCQFHSLCVQKVDWNVELQGNQRRMWKNFEIPRCYFASTSTPIDIQIHAFSDSSKKAYATAVYFRSEYDDGKVEVILLSSKTRVAPIEQRTIPRLELLGALISARLDKQSCTFLLTLGSTITAFWFLY